MIRKVITAEELFVCKVPRFYGIAWQDSPLNKFVCYPFPLNRIIGFCRKLWFRVLHQPPDYVERKCRQAHAVGHREGYEAGRKDGRKFDYAAGRRDASHQIGNKMSSEIQRFLDERTDRI